MRDLGYNNNLDELVRWSNEMSGKIRFPRPEVLYFRIVRELPNEITGEEGNELALILGQAIGDCELTAAAFAQNVSIALASLRSESLRQKVQELLDKIAAALCDNDAEFVRIAVDLLAPTGAKLNTKLV